MMMRKPCSRRIATSSAVAPVAQGTPNSLQAARTRSRFSCTSGWLAWPRNPIDTDMSPGPDARSASPYIRSRGRGDAAVLNAFPSAKLTRPAVMFGPGDAFLTPLLTRLRHMPVFPMFGSGATRLQPAYVEDVAEAIVRVLRAPAAHQLYELDGPRVYNYQLLLRTI